MKDPSEFTRPAGAGTGAQHLNGHATNTALAGTLSDAGSPGIFRRDIGGLAGRRPRWPPGGWQHHPDRPEPGTENRHTDDFLAVFSEELRSSLAAISTATETLRAEASAAPAGTEARLLIERVVEDMTRLVEDLLDVAQIRNGQFRLRNERIDLCAVVARSVRTVEVTMQQHHHRMTTSLPDVPMWLQADPARLEQVFVNLLGNAAKYTDAGGKIDLSVECKEGEAVVRVRDTGIGIAPEVLPDLFRLFVRPDPTSSRAGASYGIGLALVRSLVESHGGRVSAKSEGLGLGTEFTVRLPLSGAPLKPM
jgi:signal transduction histidine kinase